MDERATAEVVLFKPSGKYYATQRWRIPTQEEIDMVAGACTPHTFGGAIPFRKIRVDFPFLPSCMRYSPDFGCIDGGPVLVPEQEPWGFPHLILGEGSLDRVQTPLGGSASGTTRPAKGS